MDIERDPRLVEMDEFLAEDTFGLRLSALPEWARKDIATKSDELFARAHGWKALPALKLEAAE